MKFIRHKYFFPILLFFVFALGIFLRFYALGELPKGLYPDETAIGYNAYSILVSGKDEHGNSYPLYFKSFDDYKLPVYMYATAAAISAFGADAFAVRFTSALFGSLALFALYFLILELSRKKYFAVAAAFFLAINPWHIYFSRTGYEVNVATTLMLIGTLFFVMAVKRGNSLPFFLLSVLSFLISVYTYNVTRLLAPLLLLLLAVYFMKSAKLTLRSLIVPVIVFGIGFLPMFVTSMTLQSESGFSTHSDALIIGKQVKAQLIETRGYFREMPELLQKVFFNYYFLVAWTYLKNIVSFFSTAFFFILGSDKPNQNLGGGIAMFYYFEFLLIIYGAIQGIRQKSVYLYPFYLWFVLVLLIGSLVTIVPNGTRAYPVVIPMVVFSAYGFYLLAKVVLGLKNSILKYSIMTLSVFVMSYSLLFSAFSYLYRMPIEAAVDWRSEDQEAVTFILEIAPRYERVIFDDSAEFMYTSLLFYGKFDPLTHHRTAEYVPKGLVTTLRKTGKYEFRNVNWDIEAAVPGTLIITGGGKVPERYQKLSFKKFDYPTRPVAVYHDRQISQYAKTPGAYEILESGRK